MVFIIIALDYTILVPESVNNLKFNLPVRYWIIITMLFLPLQLVAQLTATGANSIRYTTYPSSPGVKDPVFFYCNSIGTERGELTAVHPGGTGSYNFSWYQWNNLTSSFSIPIKTDPGVSSSTINNLTEGGYKVDIDNAGTITSFTAWILFDKPPVVDAKLQNPLKNCDYVALDGTAAPVVNSFHYYDPVTGVQLNLANELKFMWSSSPESVIPYPDVDIDPISFSPPLEDVTYTLKVFTLGCSNESSFFYESIHVKADFSVDPETGEAPLEVNFTDKSIRGYIYKWEFGDDTISELKDPLPHTYYRPGEYSVRLTIESDRHCVDSMRFNSIVVDPSSLHIPNVFTPDGDGYNETFMVDSKSLRFISVEVFSQSGLKVYGFSGEGESLKNWTGWDGNINNSSRKATPGIYYYIIRALGWDDIKYDSKEYRGFVYLYR
jgi:PKD repeat protein